MKKLRFVIPLLVAVAVPAPAQKSDSPQSPLTYLMEQPGFEDEPCQIQDYVAEHAAPSGIAQFFETLIRVGPLQEGVSHRDYVLVNCIAARLMHGNRFGIPGTYREVVVVHSSDLVSEVNNQTGIIRISDGVLKFVGGDEDEIAFILAHELGHLADKNPGCPSKVIWTQKRCETDADQIGLQYLLGAKRPFNPLSAAALLGRFQMFIGSTNILGFLQEFLSDHPIDSNRINNLRNLLIQIQTKGYPK